MKSRTTKQIKKRKTTTKKNQNYNNTVRFVTKKRALIVALIFGVIGVTTMLFSSAAPTVSLQAEDAIRNECATVVNDPDATGGKAIKFECVTTPKIFNHPGVVYTQRDIDAWSTNSSEYGRLASTGAASLTTTSSKYVPIRFGSSIDTVIERDSGLRDQSGFAKVQAVLWAADKNVARKDKVAAYLNEYRDVTSIDTTDATYRLVAGWSCTNLAQSAEIINYRDPQFQRFLRDACYPIMDWTTGGNWHASFADSKLAIAAYLGDQELWNDAKLYFNERIKQSFYHQEYDGGKVFPMHKEDNGSNSAKLHTGPGTNDPGSTQTHWGGYWGPSQVHADFSINTSEYGLPVNGMNAERTRDLGHVNMGLYAWAHAARTILAQGETIDQHVFDRLFAGYEYHAGRVLSYQQTGIIPAPTTLKGDGGGSRFYSFESAKSLFGDKTPQSVLSMLERQEVKERPAAGANHTIAEAFADGQAIPMNQQSNTTKIGLLSGEISAPISNSYTLWVRMRAADATNNAVQVTIGNKTFRVGDNSIATQGWTWIKYHDGNVANTNTVLLNAGLHSVIVSGVESGVLIDQIMLINTDCTPIKDGSNCMNNPPEVTLGLPASGSVFTAPAKVQLQAQASDSDGSIVKVEFYEGTTLLAEDSTAPYEFSWNSVNSGSYNIIAKAYDNSGAVSNSPLVGIVVNNPTFDPEPLPIPTGFRITSKTKDSITLAWDASTDPRVDSYSVRYVKSSSPTANDYSTWIYPSPLSSTSINISNLTSGSEYIFQLRARSSQGTSNGSDDVLSGYTGSLIESTNSEKSWWQIRDRGGKKTTR